LTLISSSFELQVRGFKLRNIALGWRQNSEGQYFTTNSINVAAKISHSLRGLTIKNLA